MRWPFKIWERQYCLEPLLVFVLCIALLISLKQRKKYKILRWMPIYIVSLMVVYASGSFIDKKQHPFFLRICEYIDYAFTTIELVIFSIFYYQFIANLIVKRLIIFLNIGFCLFSFYLFFSENGFYRSPSQTIKSTVYTVEGVILLAISLYYFIELFKKPFNLNLKNDPVFWISAGVFFFFACTLPYSLLENFINRNYYELFDPFYSIFYIFYILLFLMIIRAYLCKPEKMI